LAYGANLGRRGPLIDFPLVPVTAALLHDTGDLLWSAYADNTFLVGKSGKTQAFICDPAAGTVSQKTITNTDHDLFCLGISVNFNGQIVITGGDTAAKISINNVSVHDWIYVPNMTIPRGFQSSTTVSDGRIFTIGSSWSVGLGSGIPGLCFRGIGCSLRWMGRGCQV
jgi:galactose oxidase